MYKGHRRTSKKKKDSLKTIDGKGGKIRKTEGNIVGQRITVPLDLLKHESTVTSSAKRPGTDFPIDNLHGMFDRCVNIRRSQRVLNKNCSQYIGNNFSLTGENRRSDLKRLDNPKPNPHHNDIVRSQIFNTRVELNSYKELDLKELRTSNCDKKYKDKKQPVKKSKSIFEKINKLYKSSQEYNCNSSTEETFNQKFCVILSRQISHRIELDRQTIIVCKSRILSEIEKIDGFLLGKLKMDETPVDSKCLYYYPEEDPCESNFSLYNESEWVFETPPRQKIPTAVLEHSELQPAVLCTTKKEKQLFEWKKKLQVKMTDFDGKENIPINHYMDNVATAFNYDGNMKSPNFKKPFASACSSKSNQQAMEMDYFLKPASVKKNHPLMTVLSRPQKSTIKKAITFSRVKRKFDEAMDTNNDETSFKIKVANPFGTNLFGKNENDDFKFQPMETVVNEYQSRSPCASSSLNNLKHQGFAFLPNNSPLMEMESCIDENENSFTFDSLEVKPTDFHF